MHQKKKGKYNNVKKHYFKQPDIKNKTLCCRMCNKKIPERATGREIFKMSETVRKI